METDCARVPLALNADALHQGGCGQDEEGADRDGGGGDRESVAADELPGSIGQGVGACSNRQAAAEAGEVAGEGLSGEVAPAGLLAQSLAQDHVEVATEGARARLAAPSLVGIEVVASQDCAGGGGRRLLEDGLGELVWRRTFVAERMAIREQLEEKDPEGVDVARRGHGLATDLLGAGVGRGHQARVRAREVEARLAGPVTEELGDAEVEQLGPPLAVHEDVGRLQVAMDDEVLVCGVDGLTDLDEEVDTSSEVEVLLTSEGVDRATLRELHHEVGPAVFGGSAIEQAGDSGVLEVGENLALGSEAPRHFSGGEVAAHDLDRDLLLERLVRALRAVDHAHASSAEDLDDSIGADLGELRPRCTEQSKSRPVDEGGGFPVGVEEGLDLTGELGIHGRGPGDSFGPLFFGEARSSWKSSCTWRQRSASNDYLDPPSCW